MGKITERYDKYLTYKNYNGNSEKELFAILSEQIETLEKKDVKIALSQGTKTQNIHTSKIYPGTITPYHRHNYTEMNYVISGTLAELINGEKIILNSGDLIIMSPEVYHTSHPLGKTEAINIILSLDYTERITEKLNRYNTENYLKYIHDNNAYIVFHTNSELEIDSVAKSITHVISNRREYEPFSEAVLENLAEALVLSLTRAEIIQYPSKKIPKAGCKKVKKELFSDYVASRDDKIIRYMNSHYENITLSELANQFGYSEQQIRRIIKKRTGTSFATHLQIIRMQRATELLRDTDMSIKAISETTGIASPEYFSRWFKREYVVTPTAYRKRFRNNTDKQG